MRPEKELLLNEIKDKIDASKAMIVTKYDKLAPNTSWQLRDQLSKSGSGFEIVRKKVFVKAAEKAGLKLDVKELKGHIGVVFVNQDDSLPSTKTVYQFSEANGQVLQVLFGHIEGKRMPASDLEILSKLPGMNEMRATLLGLLVAPMSQMLSVLEAKAEQNKEIKE